MDTTETMFGGGSFNKDTYIGYLKVKNGGMKVIPGNLDDKIINKRNNILEKLDKVLSGGKKLKEKNIGKYFKALGGKYIRNDMCLSGNRDDCKIAKKLSVGGAIKLMELGLKKYDSSLLETKFKGAAPVLYEKYKNNVVKPESNTSGGYTNQYNVSDISHYKMEGGNSKEILDLESLRMDIGRYQYFSGGSDIGIYYNDIELNKLRDEIDNIRNN